MAGDSEQYLRRLARTLAANRELFDHVEVVGHADQRGTNQYNYRLSERRATTIANSLISAGVSPGQVRTQGRGEAELLTRSLAPAALARNRRVEMRFHGVKNQAALKNLIDSVAR
ncbi:MAG: OmpA family protein [Calothrix sp. SM1_5_4]|nr:OmpA family protein [Calothrix sp. SM1_5_4]